MNDIRNFISAALSEGVYKFIISGRREPDFRFRKITFMLLEGDGEFFVERLTDKQAFHSRVPMAEAAAELERCFGDFRQLNAWNERFEFTARLTRRGKLLTGRRPSAAPERASGQNREKSYLLPEGCVVPPLVDMGVMTEAGAVRRNMYDKFKQINRFLEIIDDVVRDERQPGQLLNIIDFGCGKSYLTFIVYYYFSEIRHIPVRITGLDLKREVIGNCNKLAAKYGYAGLEFIAGDIADYEMPESTDLMLTLHACDTATDFALFNAIKRGTKYILSVPRCQHELAGAADFAAMPVLNDDGILRERAASLFTDGIRARLLTACGYKTQLLEFVDLSHTPKNILIRAKRTALPERTRRRALADAEELLNILKTEQTLHRLLSEAGLLERGHGG